MESIFIVILPNRTEMEQNRQKNGQSVGIYGRWEQSKIGKITIVDFFRSCDKLSESCIIIFPKST